MPRNWVGSGSPFDEEIDAFREVWAEGEDCEGVRSTSCSSSSDSSSSPMANAPPSSGTLLSVGVLALSGLRMLSTELFREVRVGLDGGCETSAASLLRCFKRSISSWPLSRVKERNASNRFLDLKTPCMKILLSCTDLALICAHHSSADLLQYWCSMIALIDSSRDCRSELFVSFARRKLGDDIDANS